MAETEPEDPAAKDDEVEGADQEEEEEEVRDQLLE